jgi:hypothetical protein
LCSANGKEVKDMIDMLPFAFNKEPFLNSLDQLSTHDTLDVSHQIVGEVLIFVF